MAGKKKSQKADLDQAPAGQIIPAHQIDEILDSVGSEEQMEGDQASVEAEAPKVNDNKKPKLHPKFQKFN